MEKIFIWQTELIDIDIYKEMRVSEMSEMSEKSVKHWESIEYVGEIAENCRRYFGIRCWEVVIYLQFFNYPQ